MGDIAITVVDELSDQESADILELILECTAFDSAYPFSEHVLLNLRHGSDHSVQHVIAREDGRLAGYAHLDNTDTVDGPSAELAVHPDMRRHGVGSLLLSGLMVLSRPRALRLWAHGEAAGAASLAHNFGFEKVRTLWQMRRSLFASVLEAPLPDGITLRNFHPTDDVDAWLECNRRAFAHHPEQGRWTRRDLESRMKEPWFDAKGFIVAEDLNGRIVGFHWTKIHGVDERDAHLHEPVGEVYVVGVDPDWQGKQLGRALTAVGLRYLRHLGLRSAMLYVDSADERAVALYESIGFAHWDTDTLFRDPLMPLD
ncbi:MAG: mycothiol acetyltransferase [Actinomycetota bacterium]|jgi:mycothiol synthase